MEVSGQIHAPAALLQEKSPRTHLLEGRGGPRAGLDEVVKRKISFPSRESNRGRPARSIVTTLRKYPCPLPVIEPRSSNPKLSHILTELPQLNVIFRYELFLYFLPLLTRVLSLLQRGRYM
jgi:hypothetical protein